MASAMFDDNVMHVRFVVREAHVFNDCNVSMSFCCCCLSGCCGGTKTRESVQYWCGGIMDDMIKIMSP